MHGILSFDPDAARVRAIANGSRQAREAALRELMAVHADRLHRMAAHMLGDAASAEDVVQETFLKAWSRAADWTPGQAKFGTWLSRVATNACLDRLRKRKPTGDMPEEIADGEAPADARLIARERAETVRHAILALPERQRAALVLSAYAGLNQREAAATLDITEGAYESLLVRARRHLRDTLGGRDDL